MSRVNRAAVMVAVSGAAMVGCTATGLSTREVPGQSQALYLYSLYDDAPVAGDVSRPTLTTPARVGVVQVGEVAPGNVLLDALRAAPDVFAQVQPLSGIADTGGAYNRTGSPAGDRHMARQHVDRLRTMAADAGLDYLMLVGGTIESNRHGTPLSILDVTIIGAFVIPSQQATAEAKASAAVVDVRSGRIVFTSSGEADDRRLYPTVSAGDETVAFLRGVRDKVLADLARNVVRDAKARTTATAPVAAAASNTR